MVNIILGLAVLLILVILFMLFRIQRLVSIARNSSTQKVGTSNNVNAALMLIVPIVLSIAAIWYSGKASEHFLPEAASKHGVETDQLFWISIIIISLMFAITNAGLFFFAYKYRYKEGTEAKFYPHNNKLELIWTIVPAVILTVLVVYGNKVWWKIMADPPKDAEVIELMGQQFSWQARYPGKDKKLGPYNHQLITAENEFGIDFSKKESEDDITVTSEMHIPVGRPVLLKIRSRDVIHSVFLPHFRVKMDAVPGMPTTFLFTATKTTKEMRAELENPEFTYELACTEICGKGHFGMKYTLVVDDEEDYKAWLTSQKPFLENNPSYAGKGMNSFKKNKKGEKKKTKSTKH